MNVELYQDVILTVDLPEQGLCAGDVGVLVERHDVPDREVGYSVEFFDMTGRTVAVVAETGGELGRSLPGSHRQHPLHTRAFGPYMGYRELMSNEMGRSARTTNRAAVYEKADHRHLSVITVTGERGLSFEAHGTRWNGIGASRPMPVRF